ncbi:hypothetical protein BKA83DRAFT_4160040 [Pisolithus microcarpus]|nr:hypothetical protein BKA83DRAFT_4160040 [Pisolithus microcarpus]
MNNSQNQNPCVVASYIMGVCWNGPFDVPALGPGIYYYQVNGLPTACECSAVAYCLISACAACQNGPYFNWPSWSRNCSTAYVGYPFSIPSGTAIPQWAYQNVTSSGDFNIGLAQEVGDGPESAAPTALVTTSSTTASPTPPPTSFTLSTTLPSTQPLTTSSISFASSTSSSSTQKGAIVGGVVGGGVGLAAAATVTWFFVCRRRKIRLPRADDDE